MAPANYQTVRLRAGKHSSPEDGACVMELASMLAREPFSDYPRSVCPVVAGFLRTYNDLIDDERRQDLYDYAARAVGTRASRPVERIRTEMCVRFARQRRSWIATVWYLLPGFTVEVAAIQAARAAARDKGSHLRALRFVDELIAVPEPCDPLEEPARPVFAREEPGRTGPVPDRRGS
jgi:hypothetical protein